MKKRPNQERKILRLVYFLAALGLIIVVTTLGLVGWTVAKIREERSAAIAAQFELEEATRDLRDRTVETRVMLLDWLDESSTEDDAANGVRGLVDSIVSQRGYATIAPAGAEAIVHLQLLVTNLIDLEQRVLAWRKEYVPLSEDLRVQSTVNQVRSMLKEMRQAVESEESLRRLDDAMKYRLWRNASGEEAARQAHAILSARGWAPLQAAADFKGNLIELARLVEILNGEEQFDNLSDLKNNHLSPVLDHLARSLATLVESGVATNDITVDQMKLLRKAILCEVDQVSTNTIAAVSLVCLRQDVLRLRRDREHLKAHVGDLFHEIESATTRFGQVTDTLAATLSLKTEHDLAASWRNLLATGAISSTVFLWLAWRISRGIQGQVGTIEQARAEAESNRKQSHILMLQHQTVATELSAINAALDRSYILAATDIHGTITQINDNFCVATGFRRDELVGHSYRLIYPGGVPEGDFDEIWRTVSRGGIWQGEVCNRSKAGNTYWVAATIVPLHGQARQPKGYLAICSGISERKAQEAKLADLNKQLMEASRHAGMAEVATGVLHNVGNVLNSVNVSATILSDLNRKLPTADLHKVVNLLREQGDHLGTFFSSDPRGGKVCEFLKHLGDRFDQQQKSQEKELSSLVRNIEHIKEIVAMQQSYARVSGVTETVNLAELIGDTLRINADGFQRHGVKLVSELDPGLPAILTEKHKVLQILVNLVRNAKHACEAAGEDRGVVKVRAQRVDECVRIQVVDSGVGIPAGNLQRIFNHGFTTKKNGHGFGLHSSANSAKALGGLLTVESEGTDKGAVFTLILPISPPADSTVSRPELKAA